MQYQLWVIGDELLLSLTAAAAWVPHFWKEAALFWIPRRHLKRDTRAAFLLFFHMNGPFTLVPLGRSPQTRWIESTASAVSDIGPQQQQIKC